MSTAIITEQVALLRSPFTVDQTGTTIAALAASQTARPNGSGTFAPGGSFEVQLLPERLVFIPYGLSAVGVVEQWLRIRLTGWRRALLLGSPDLWLSRPLTEVRCRLALGMPGFGVAGTAIPAGRVGCDRIEVVDGYRVGRSGIEVEDGIPGASAEALIANRGCTLITGQIALEGAAAGNFLIGGL